MVCVQHKWIFVPLFVANLNTYVRLNQALSQRNVMNIGIFIFKVIIMRDFLRIIQSSINSLVIDFCQVWMKGRALKKAHKAKRVMLEWPNQPISSQPLLAHTKATEYRCCQSTNNAKNGFTRYLNQSILCKHCRQSPVLKRKKALNCEFAQLRSAFPEPLRLNGVSRGFFMSCCSVFQALNLVCLLAPNFNSSPWRTCPPGGQVLQGECYAASAVARKTNSGWVSPKVWLSRRFRAVRLRRAPVGGVSQSWPGRTFGVLTTWGG